MFAELYTFTKNCLTVHLWVDFTYVNYTSVKRHENIKYLTIIRLFLLVGKALVFFLKIFFDVDHF